MVVLQIRYIKWQFAFHLKIYAQYKTNVPYNI